MNYVDPSGNSAFAATLPWATGLANLDSPVPGYADLAAGVLLAGALLVDGGTWVYDRITTAKPFPTTREEIKNGPIAIERSKNPPAKRVQTKSKKDAYEKAKKAGKGAEPIHHPNGTHGPHYHPNVQMPKKWTPKVPNPHDHYYYPRSY